VPLSHIEHCLVVADDMDQTRDWYCDVLGMAEGPHPDFGFPVHWLYLNGRDVVHIGQSAKHAGESQKIYLGGTLRETGSGTGAIDPIAFGASGLKAMLAHLRSRGIEFIERRAGNHELYQLFVHDPNGIKIELNFDADEAQGLEPEVSAAKFAKA